MVQANAQTQASADGVLKTSAKVDMLEEGRAYSVRVCAANEAGQGPYCPPCPPVVIGMRTRKDKTCL